MTGLLDRLRMLFADLAPRERFLVGAAGLVLVVALVWFAVVTPVMASIEQAGMRVDTAQRELELSHQLRGELGEMQSRLAAVEQRIRSGPNGNIFTTLEQLAQQSAVKIESIEPQASPSQDRFRETKVQVALKEVTLAQAVNFLHRIESSRQLLSVKSLRVRTRADKSDLLDLTFTVSAFELR